MFLVSYPAHRICKAAFAFAKIIQAGDGYRRTIHCHLNCFIHQQTAVVPLDNLAERTPAYPFLLSWLPGITILRTDGRNKEKTVRQAPVFHVHRSGLL